MRQTSILDNQLHIVTETIPGAQSVCIGVMSAACPQNEPEDKGGLAHLTEHSFFLGTSARDAFEICQLADSTCGNIGAFTARDYTCFYAHIMRDYRPFAWDLLGDILLNSTFPAEGIANERDIILQEIGAAHDHPQTRLNDLLKRSIWPKHGLGRPVTGDADSLSRLTREDVIYFVGQNYLPDRMVVAAVGDVDHDTAVAEAQDSFWRMLGNSQAADDRSCEFESTTIAQTSGVSHAYFSMAFPSRPFADPDRYRTHALNTILGGGLSSRLYTRIRQQMHAVYEVNASYDAYRAAGTFTIDGVTSPEYLGKVLSAAFCEIDEIAQHGVDEEDMHRTKMQLQGQYLLAGDSSHTRMSRLLTQQFYFGRTFDEQEVIEQIDGLCGEDLQLEAQRMLQSSRPTIAVLTPDHSDVSVNELRDILNAQSELAGAP